MVRFAHAKNIWKPVDKYLPHLNNRSKIFNRQMITVGLISCDSGFR